MELKPSFSASALSPAHCKGLKPVIELTPSVLVSAIELKPNVAVPAGNWDLGLELEMTLKVELKLAN